MEGLVDKMGFLNRRFWRLRWQSVGQSVGEVIRVSVEHHQGCRQEPVGEEEQELRLSVKGGGRWEEGQPVFRASKEGSLQVGRRRSGVQAASPSPIWL